MSWQRREHVPKKNEDVYLDGKRGEIVAVLPNLSKGMTMVHILWAGTKNPEPMPIAEFYQKCEVKA